MSTAVAPRPAPADSAIVKALLHGDLSSLNETQKLAHYNNVCISLGLNPMTRPFAYLTLNGKLVLYALKDCCEQLRKNHEVSLEIKTREVIEGVYVVTAKALMPSGRVDESTGAVPIETLKGEARANAMLKAETKAKRRVTLSICGLGFLDETEVESIQAASVDPVPRVFPHARVVKMERREKPPIAWAVITFVDEHGVEYVLPTGADAREAAVSLFEQLMPEELVTLTTEVGKRNRKEQICKVERERAQKQIEPAKPEATDGVVDDSGVF